MPLSGNTPAQRSYTLSSGIGVNAPPAEEAGGNTPSIQEALRDAEHRELDFPAKERANYVRAMIQRTQDYKSSGRSIREIRELLPEFARDYPHLFDTVLEDGYDKSNLATMLTMLERMGDGQLNQHQATVIVGQRLAKKYIHPSNSR